MPRHHPCLHASAAFWPVNSLLPQPDHPELGPDPFTQTHYDTERIQVPEAKVSIPAVSLPAGVQVWKGVADSVANVHGYLPKPDQTYTPVELPQFNHSGFYGSSKTAQQYSAVTRTEENTPGIELSFVTKHGLKLIDIGNVQTANALRELINTITPEKVACDPRYSYILEMQVGVFPNTESSKDHTSIKHDEKANQEMMKDVPFGDTQAIANHLYLDQIRRRYDQENGNKVKMEEKTFEFFCEYVEHDRKGLVRVVQTALAHEMKTKINLRGQQHLSFQTSYRHSEPGFDIALALLFERFLSKFCYFDGWVYIRDEDVEHTNLHTMTRSLKEYTETSPTKNGFHSEIYLTDQGKAKIDYVGYNRFDA